jgi:hypothetical protein
MENPLEKGVMVLKPELFDCEIESLRDVCVV